MTSFEGLLLRPNRHDEARQVLLRAGGDRVGGHARQHRRHRDAGVQHRRRGPVVPARDRPYVAAPATSTSPPTRRQRGRVLAAHGDGTRYGIAADPADGLLTRAPRPSR